MNNLKHFNCEVYRVEDFPGSLIVYSKSFLIKCEYSDMTLFFFHTPGKRKRTTALCGSTCNIDLSVSDAALVVI